MFAIFCGLLIMFDYLMCILLVFPALCIYDKKLMENRSGCCNACDVFRKKGSGIENEGENDESQSSLIHRILYKYYVQLHRFRWYLFGISVAAFGAAIYGATTLELPTSAEVRLFEEDVVEYEQNYIWRQNLLHETLKKSGGSDTLIGFGLSPDDTGDLSNPKSWSQLILDPTFDAAPEESQIFLESFCPTLFAEAFAMEVSDSYTCPFNLFALWLQEQSNSTTPDEGYVANCANAIGIPVPPSNFDSCLIEWSKQQGETSILSNGGKVRIIFLSFLSRIRWDSPFDVLDAEWNLIEDWVKKTAATAPEGVNKFFFSSMEFWWFDTNSQMLTTAYGAASIALAAAAIVIFLSSRSFVLTLFATLTIFYVLCSVTSTLVALDWTLGFLESICFAILIGVSVDFVIHFCHAYAHIPGEVDRHKRTQIALIRMGPSILAAGVTTIAAAIIMLFTIISFFQKFALILFMTIIQATIGSFIVFLTLTDCFGPSNPTVFVDKGIAVILGKFGVQKPATERLSTSSDLGLTATDEERAGGKIEGK
jgi:5-methyltetrahydrofolate--homocysteine methyltransferase